MSPPPMRLVKIVSKALVIPIAINDVAATARD